MRGLVLALSLAPLAAGSAALATPRAAAEPSAVPRAGDSPSIENPAIDMAGHLRLAREAAELRERRRVSEAEFVRMSREPGTVIPDARSRETCDELHVRGAVHLSFPDFTVESLARRLPDPNPRILIYCNHNFENAEGPFPRKLASASLNLSTFVALHTYGYRNVHELGPLIDIGKTLLELESSMPGWPR
jgi:hypothetical protein